MEAFYTRLSEMMEAEGVFQVRRWLPDIYTVELTDGRRGRGKTPREAIEAARAEPAKVAA
jgi:hypothetical protein